MIVSDGKVWTVTAGLLLAIVLFTQPWSAATATEPASSETGGGYIIPFGDPERGRALFTGKGCVVCHAINGVGGKAGPSFDADASSPNLDVFEFAARMWRGAPLMTVLQEMELGYQIEFTGQELADLARFLHDAEAQKDFDQSDVPEVIRDWMVDEVYDELDAREMAQ